jgi:DNA-binding transcriptional LysR family regulator
MAKTEHTVADSRTIDLNAVAVFASVVRAGSFTRAAAQLGQPKSAVSRKVARLERSLGVRLLQRTTRRLHLSDAGARYYGQASKALEGLSDAARTLSSLQEQPQGTVRLTAPADFIPQTFAKLLDDFARKHPKVCIEIEFTSRVVDLVAEGFDLALRGTDTLRDSSLISRRIAITPLWLVASPAYLKRRGTPKNPADLARHDCILFRPQAGANRWKLSGPRGEQTLEVRGAFGVDDMGFARELACRGSGIALIPSPTIADDLLRGRLSRVLPEHRGPLAHSTSCTRPRISFPRPSVCCATTSTWSSAKASARIKLFDERA